MTLQFYNIECQTVFTVLTLYSITTTNSIIALHYNRHYSITTNRQYYLIALHHSIDTLQDYNNQQYLLTLQYYNKPSVLFCPYNKPTVFTVLTLYSITTTNSIIALHYSIDTTVLQHRVSNSIYSIDTLQYYNNQQTTVLTLYSITTTYNIIALQYSIDTTVLQQTDSIIREEVAAK